jgi:serine/threonine protein kinase
MLIDDQGHIVLCDFGLTRRLRQGKEYYRQMTDVDMPMPWMAPEAFVGVGDKFDVKTDVWFSLRSGEPRGKWCVCFQALTRLRAVY